MKFIQISDKIIIIEDFFSDEECQKYIDLSESLGYEVANIDTGKIVLEVRNNERVFYKSEDLAQEIYERVKFYLPKKIGKSKLCGLNELFRFYKYQKGHRFKGHQDGNFIKNETEASYLTFMIYLNEDYEGGHTIFREYNITPKKGMVLVFYHKLYHQGDEVLNGIKYVLRSDVMYQLEIENII